MPSPKLPTASLLVLAVSAGSVFAVPPSDRLLNGKSRFGQASVESEGARLVDVSTTKNLNVRCGDTVTFVNGSKKFSWTFNTTTHAGVPLSKIAPADFGAVTSMVYVSRNEAERGG